jgi:hypothetical protein
MQAVVWETGDDAVFSAWSEVVEWPAKSSLTVTDLNEHARRMHRCDDTLHMMLQSGAKVSATTDDVFWKISFLTLPRQTAAGHAVRSQSASSTGESGASGRPEDLVKNRFERRIADWRSGPKSTFA